MKFKENGKPLVLLLIEDLIFVSKISIAAKETGVKTRSVTKNDLDDIENLVGVADLLIIDMNAEYINPMEFIRTVSKLPTGQDIRVIGFASHIQHDIMKEAEQYPEVTVLTRSQFVEQLPGILQGVKQE